MLMTVCDSWLDVVMTCAFDWKARCAVIMLTSWVVRSTFELSSAPDWMLPKPAEFAVPCTGTPDWNVADQFVLPSSDSPCGFGKLAIAIWPSCVERPFV